MIDISMSIVILDNSVENFLSLVVGYKQDKNTRISYDFKPLVDLSAEILDRHDIHIDKNSIIQMHHARNVVQHSGVMLVETQVSAYFSLIAFLYQNCKNIFSISWDQISLSLLIQNKDVALLCKEGEEHFNKGNFRQAANKFIMAFEISKANRQVNQFGSGIAFKRAKLSWNKTKMKDDINDILDYVYSIDSEIEVLKLGVDYKKWREYRIVLGNLDPYEDFNYEILKESPDNPCKIENRCSYMKGGKIDIAEDRDDLEKHNNNIDNSFEMEIPLRKYSDEEIRVWLSHTMPFIISTIVSWEENEGLFELTD